MLDTVRQDPFAARLVARRLTPVDDRDAEPLQARGDCQHETYGPRADDEQIVQAPLRVFTMASLDLNAVTPSLSIDTDDGGDSDSAR